MLRSSKRCCPSICSPSPAKGHRQTSKTQSFPALKLVAAAVTVGVFFYYFQQKISTLESENAKLLKAMEGRIESRIFIRLANRMEDRLDHRMNHLVNQIKKLFSPEELRASIANLTGRIEKLEQTSFYLMEEFYQMRFNESVVPLFEN